MTAEQDNNPKCQHCQCGKPATIYASDPFAEEVWNDITEKTWWCDKCYQDQCDEV